MALPPDGRYDAVVVDVEELPSGERLVDLVITLGPHVGRNVTLRHEQIDPPTRRRGTAVEGRTRPVGDVVDGLAGTLLVRAGRARFRPEWPVDAGADRAAAPVRHIGGAGK